MVVVDVDPSAAAELIAKGEVRVLDVRTPEEFALGHIEGAINQNVNGPDFASALEDLPHDKPYLVHCAAGTPGGRSRRATEALQSAGSKRIYHLDGGLIAWSGGGNPTVTVDGDD
ncbi:MAG: rhodanese-like domain-containing protein [Myxococcota bacterium]